MRLHHNRTKGGASISVVAGGQGYRLAMRYVVLSTTRAGQSVLTDNLTISGHSESSREYVYQPTSQVENESRGDHLPTTADEWVRRNFTRLKRHAGKWVAVSPQGLIAVSGDFDEVFRRAREQGIRVPLVFKVPVHREGLRVVSAKRW